MEDSEFDMDIDSLWDSGIVWDSGNVWDAGTAWNYGIEQQWDAALWEEELLLEEISDSYDENLRSQKVHNSLADENVCSEKIISSVDKSLHSQRIHNTLTAENLCLQKISDSFDDDLCSQKLLKSLGKKEGELEGFKDLLNKAKNDLQRSEEAMLEVQKQLQEEKEKGENSVADWKTEELQVSG